MLDYLRLAALHRKLARVNEDIAKAYEDAAHLKAAKEGEDLPITPADIERSKKRLRKLGVKV